MGGYNRRVSRKKALRKQKIAKKLYGGERFDNLHQYSKNKVHCSCQLCRFRSVFNPNAKTYSDMKKELSMEAKLNEYYKEVI